MEILEIFKKANVSTFHQEFTTKVRLFLSVLVFLGGSDLESRGHFFFQLKILISKIAETFPFCEMFANISLINCV